MCPKVISSWSVAVSHGITAAVTIMISIKTPVKNFFIHTPPYVVFFIIAFRTHLRN